MGERIFVVEDDENIREIINLALVSNGYEVVQFDNAIDALAEIDKKAPSLAIFDLMLPKMSGIDAIKEIRETDREIDKVNGLDSGSDDYMTKPFGILELQARVRSLLRRHVTSDIIRTKHLTVDKQTRLVKLDDQKLELTNKEYQLLVYLMDNKHRVVEREELLNEIWGYDFIGDSRALDVHIRALRSKLNDDGHKYIKTIRSVGYRFYEEGDGSE